MAGLDTEPHKGLKELENEITCPICQDFFQEPKILPCFHYYCKKCVQSLAERAGDNQPFACPECRSDAILPQNDSNQLPTAFFVNRMKELHTNMEKAHGRIEACCELCSGNKAIAFCRQCVGFICNECMKAHQRMRTFDGHKTTTLEDLRKGGAKEKLVKEPPIPICKEHEEKQKIYCFDCHCLICRDCTVFDHKDHKCEFVKKAASEMKAKLVGNLVPLKEVQASLRHTTKTIKSTKVDIEMWNASMVKKINESFDEFHAIIEERRQQLLEEASHMTKEKLDQLQLQEKGFEISLSTIQSLVDFVEQSIENATEHELLTYHAQMLNKLDEETKKYQQTYTGPKPAQITDVMLKIDASEKLRNVCKKDVYLIKCSIEGIIDAHVGIPAHVTVACKSVSSVHVAANLISSLEGVVVQAKVTVLPKQKNLFDVEYTPQVRGRHKLEITANGLPVRGSPFSVVAKIPTVQYCNPVKVITGLTRPVAIAVNSMGEVLVAEQQSGIVTINKSGRKMHTNTEKFKHGSIKLEGVAVDGDDNVYVTDNQSGCLFKFNKFCQQLKVFDRSCGVQDFDPWGVSVFQEQVIVTQSTKPLLSFTRSLELVKKINFDGNGLGITHDLNGYMYVCDISGSCIKVLNSRGEFLYSFGDKESGELLSHPRSVCVDGGQVYVSEWDENHCVSIFTKHGKFLTSFGNNEYSESWFNYPSGLAFSDDGVLYVCDGGNCRLLLF